MNWCFCMTNIHAIFMYNKKHQHFHYYLLTLLPSNLFRVWRYSLYSLLLLLLSLHHLFVSLSQILILNEVLT